MPSYSLATHLIGVGPKGSPKLFKASKLPRGRTLPDEVARFLEQKEEFSLRHDEDADLFKVLPGTHKSAMEDGRRTGIYGRIASSSFGKRFNFTHRTDPDDELEQSVNHARDDPFFFFFEFRDDYQWGVMVLQRVGSAGIYTKMDRALKAYINLRFGSELTLRTPQRAPTKMVERAVSGGVKMLRFYQHRVTDDLAEKLSLEGYKDDIQEVEIRVKAKKDKLLSIERSVGRIAEGADIGGLVTLEAFDPDQSKVTVNIDGKDRVIRMTEGGPQLTAYWDVTDKVDNDSDGHARVPDLVRESAELADMIWETLELPE